jgi:uncharacterized membrane protein
MQRLLSIIAAVIFVASSASTADAAALSIKLCNQYRQVTDFALALQEKGSWTSMGWWHVATGKCTVLSAVLPVDSVYLSYVFPAEQRGLVNAERRFAVDTRVYRFSSTMPIRLTQGRRCSPLRSRRRTSVTQRGTSHSPCSKTART